MCGLRLGGGGNHMECTRGHSGGPSKSEFYIAAEFAEQMDGNVLPFHININDKFASALFGMDAAEYDALSEDAQDDLFAKHFDKEHDITVLVKSITNCF